MQLLSKLFIRFAAKPQPVASAAGYADADFLEAVADLARKRPQPADEVKAEPLAPLPVQDVP